jgi:hypothetical protein
MQASPSRLSHKIPTVAIVGSRKLSGVPSILLEDLLGRVPDDAIFLLRHPLHGEANRFEQIVASWLVLQKRPYGWMRPEPGGRSAVYNRDITMVGKSDLVLAFFYDTEMSGGTEHMVEKAMDQFVSVYSYGVYEHGYGLIGSFDPSDAWGRMTI